VHKSLQPFATSFPIRKLFEDVDIAVSTTPNANVMQYHKAEDLPAPHHSSPMPATESALEGAQHCQKDLCNFTPFHAGCMPKRRLMQQVTTTITSQPASRYTTLTKYLLLFMRVSTEEAAQAGARHGHPVPNQYTARVQALLPSVQKQHQRSGPRLK
jgi:hypothetical protein